MTEPTLTDDEMERIPLRARLANLRDDIRSTPMLHQADAVARERWGEALSTLVNELLLVDEALSTLVNELLLVEEAALRAVPDHEARAHALREALCDILSATGASAHAIPRLAMEALARDEAFCEAHAAAPDVAHHHRCVGCGLRWTDLPGAELCGDCWRTAQPHVHARAAAPEEP
ncbi:MAG: hypothetical protein DMF56_27125 [Acidobacteria bacterium]|nr:MAG: hypothetical protein DMF56_27125 [Acidobacteriota bacterium]